MKLLDGKKLANKIKENLKQEIQTFKTAPGLAVVLVGQNPASEIYVNYKIKACEEIGIASFVYRLEQNASEKNLLALITKLNKDKKVHGILVQLPLPKHIDVQKIIKAIDPKKDVDCFHPSNIGKFTVGKPNFTPCTPAGIIRLLEEYKISIAGKHCVVIGRSNIVGKPTALLLLQKHGTVTIAHSQTKKLKELCQKADILVVAVGKEKFIKKNMIKKGVVIVDVGMNRLADRKVTGDVDFENCKNIARAITSVPGGVGPMTIASLMENCVKAYKSGI